jgi:predicted site-specific integrase-resolvase
LGQAAEEQRLHLEWRQLQNRVAHDPEVVAAKAATTTAKTDLEKRVRLRTYYNVYYAHMQALASSPEIKSYLDGKKAAALESLAQHRVRATPVPQPSRAP